MVTLNLSMVESSAAFSATVNIDHYVYDGRETVPLL